MAETVRCVVDWLWTGGNPEITEAALSKTVSASWPPERPPCRGRAAVLDAARRLQSAFPQAVTVIHEVVTEDEVTVAHLVTEGTHEGDYFGVDPTGRRVSIQQVALVQVLGGVIEKLSIEYDVLAVLEDLGVVPPLPSVPAPAVWLMSRVSASKRALRALRGRRGLPSSPESWGSGHPTSPAATKLLSDAILQGLFNGHDYSVLERVMASNVVVHHPVSRDPVHGIEGFADLPRKLFQGFPDLSVEVEVLVAEGDRLGSRWVIQGTHRGVYRGVPPTGNPVRIPVQEVIRVRDGKIAEMWFGIDLLGVAQQIVLPSLESISRMHRLARRVGLS